MAPRILTALLLLLAFTREGTAQPTSPRIEFDQAAMDSARAATIARMQAEPRPPPPPPIWPRSSTQIDRADVPGVLLAGAVFLREWLAGADSIVINERFDARADSSPLVATGHVLVTPTADELALLRRELRAETGSGESVFKNCRGDLPYEVSGPFRCEMTVTHFIRLGQPVLRTNGTVTMVVEHTWRTPTDRGNVVSLRELVLARAGEIWTVERLHFHMSAP